MEADRKPTALLFHQDAYLRSATARVTACDAVDAAYAVVLDRTVLYPEGGGQPSDRGTVAGVEVMELSRRKDGAVVHLLERPVEGTVVVEVDWDRRYDHMQQHTAQHLLTAVALGRHGLRTTAFHLGPERSDIELDTPDLPVETVRDLEEEVNARIREDLPVGCRWADRSELETLGVRSRRLPDELEGPVRLVEILGVDLNTCGGTHVAGTKEIQAIKLVGTERMRGGARLFYLAGGRVLEWMGGALQRENELNRLLSCGPADHARTVEKLLADAEAGRREQRRALLKAAGDLGVRLAAEQGVSELHEPKGDMAFLKAVHLAVQKAAPEKWLFLTAGEEEGVFLVAGPAALVREVGPKVADLLGGRGGGPEGSFQGKAARMDRRAEALSLVLKAAFVRE